MTQLTITKPDDFHLHLREGELLKTTVPHTAQRFARAIVMPNLTIPITTLEKAQAYQKQIYKALPIGTFFQALMTLYLTEETKAQDLIAAKKSGVVFACKLYPAHATTNAQHGVAEIEKIYPLLETMQDIDLPLLIHGEVTGHEYDVFDREEIFLEKSLRPIIKNFPNLRVVLEHITTKKAVHFIEEASAKVAATITAHHLLLDRNDLFHKGINPHHYCLPILKRKSDQAELIKAATSGNPKFFLGTDSAPHDKSKKECDHGCAGIYTAHAALELYAEVFAKAQALDKLEAFASFYGADFYQLPRNKETITLEEKAWQVPLEIAYGDGSLIPFRAGEMISWRVRSGASAGPNIKGEPTL